MRTQEKKEKKKKKERHARKKEEDDGEEEDPTVVRKRIRVCRCMGVCLVVCVVFYLMCIRRMESIALYVCVAAPAKHPLYNQK